MNNILRHAGYSARIEFDAADGIFFGRIADIEDGVTFHADTVADLVTAFREAVEDYRETCKQIGKTPERPFSGKLMLRVDPAVHAKSVVAARLSGVSLNSWGESVLKEAAERIVTA